MKKLISMILCLAMVLSILPVGLLPVSAAEEVVSGECGAEGDNVTWVLYDDGLLEITGTGAMAEYSTASTSTLAPWTDQTDSIKSVTIADGITRIGMSTFNEHANLSEVSIPDSVSYIGNGAFWGCRSLTGVVLPKTLTEIRPYTFYGCTGLTEISIPDAVTSIGMSAFEECSKLSSVKISSSVKTIGDNAFSGCSSLMNVNIPDSVTSIEIYAFKNCTALTSFSVGSGLQEFDPDIVSDCPELLEVNVSSSNAALSSENGVLFNKSKTELILLPRAFIGDYQIPDSVVSIGQEAFSGCVSLSKVSIPDGVTTIESSAFSDCTALTAIEIPDSVTSIGSYAFSQCTNLADLTMSQNVKVFEQGVFAWCEKLTGIVFPSGTTTIEMYAFNSCISLSNVVIPGSVTQIGESAFRNCEGMGSITIPKGVSSIGARSFGGCSKLSAVVIEEGVTEIGDSAFGSCEKLSSISIPESVATIGNYAFSGCSSLRSIAIPEAVTVIGYGTFQGCSALTSVKIPGNVTSLCNGAFSDCTGLKTANFLGDAPEIGINVFTNCAESFKIYYPPVAAGWTTPEWNGYPAYPYENAEFKDEWKVRSDAHCIVVVDGSGTNPLELEPFEGADVTISHKNSGISYGTDENGLVFYTESGLRDVYISAEGYREYRAQYTTEFGSSRVFRLEKDRGDGLPYFTMIAAVIDSDMNTIDLRDQAMHFTQGGDESLTLKLHVATQGSTEGKIIIYQYATEEYPRVEYKFTYRENAYTGVLVGERFLPDRPVYIQFIGEDGLESTPVELNLFIDPVTDYGADSDSSLDRDEEEYDGSLDVFGDHKVNVDNEIVNDILNADFSVKSELIPLHVIKIRNNSDNSVTYRITVGLRKGGSSAKLYDSGKVKTESYKEENAWDDFVSMFNTFKKDGDIDKYIESVRKDYKDSLKPNKIHAVAELEADVAGYFTVTFDKNGKIVDGKTSGGFALQMDAKKTSGRTFFVSGIPVYVELIVGADMALDIGLSVTELMELIAVLEKIETRLPYVYVGGGVGVRGVAQLGARGGVEHEVQFRTEAEELKIGGEVTSTVFIYVNILNIIEKEFGKEATRLTLCTWGDYQKSKAAANAAAQAKLLYGSGSEEEEGFQLVEREYLDYEGQWNSVPITLLTDDPLSTLQHGTMPDAMPRIHTVGDKQVLLFLQDVADRAVGNHTRLVYSVFENGAWSEPAPVWESDSGDFFFDSVAVGDKIYVAWQKSSEVVEGTDPEALLNAVTEHSEICLAVWDSGTNTFTRQQYLTNDSTLDMMPSVAVDGSTATVVWVSNDANNALGEGGTYTIHQFRVENGTPGERKDLCATSDYVAEIAAGSNGEVFFMAVNEDGTTNVYRVKDGAAETVMENGSFAGLSYEGNHFLWQEDGILYRYSTDLELYDAMVAPTNGGVSSSYRYVSNGETDAVIWAEASDEFSIMASIFSGGAWQEPVALVEGISENITYLDGELTEDGKYTLVVNTAVFGEEGYESTALEYALVEPYADVVLKYASVEYQDPDTDTQQISISLENTGAAAVEQVTVTVSAGGASCLSKTYDVDLQPGGSCVLSDLLDVSDITGLTTADVTVKAAKDLNAANNSSQVALGHTDLALGLDSYRNGDIITFLLTASNNSRIDTTATLRITADGVDGTEVAVRELGTIGNEENIQYIYSLNINKIDFGGSGSRHYYFTLSGTEADWSENDNMCVFSVAAPVETEENPGGEVIEVEVIQPESIEIVSGDLRFASPEAEAVQLAVNILPEDASVTDVQWESADSSVAYVTSDGTVTPVGPGTTTVTVTLGYALTDTITVTVGQPTHSHTVSIEPGIPATCTESGLSDGSYCSECGDMLRKQEEIPALGHRYDAWKTVEAATCTEKGSEKRTCVCGEVETRETGKLGHSFTNYVTDGNATCTADGTKTAICDRCEKTDTVTDEGSMIPHDYDFVITPPTCTKDGYTTHTCTGCGDSYVDSHTDALGHEFGDWKTVKGATCTGKGSEKRTCVCGKVETRETDALGHDFVDGICTVCGEADPNYTEGVSVIRIAGTSRSRTAYKAADELKEVLGIEKFDTIILASGDNFADALAGSYLAAVKKAPILLYRPNALNENADYITRNLADGGKVYILGGTASVSQEMEDTLTNSGITVKRLAGSNRYNTNLAILKEAGINGNEILVSTGLNFADSLSASATGLPILLVNSNSNKLTDAQIDFLEEVSGAKITIIGGTSSVSQELAEALSAYGTVGRVSGPSREKTSVAVAERYFPDADCAMVAYSRNYPDGLCGGPLAYILGAPLLLTDAGREAPAQVFVEAKGITRGIALGGPASVKDSSVRIVFAMSDSDVIEVK